MDEEIIIKELNPDQIERNSLFCIKDEKAPGFLAKKAWYIKEYENGLRIALGYVNGEPAGFIEYTEVENAWRPVLAENALFIHCLMVYPKKNKNLGLGGMLINHCIKDAAERGRTSILTFGSKGSWMANKEIFSKLGFETLAKKERFELLQLSLDDGVKSAHFIDWTRSREALTGWHLFYANQCPWHQKGVDALVNTAAANGIDLQLSLISDSADAQNAPGGFGVFSLVNDGEELADHYISKTRFENILKKL